MTRATPKPLPASFYNRDTELVARELLGAVLECTSRGIRCRGRIVETEAYIGEHDPACHAALGRTARTEGLWGPPGSAYVYLIYGMYWCANAVTREQGLASAVLLRAVEPLEGIDTMRRRRKAARADHDLTNRPGKLCDPFGICGPLHPGRHFPPDPPANLKGECLPGRRAQMYYYTSDGAAHTGSTPAELALMDLFNTSQAANAKAAAAALSTVGGATFGATANVYALLCRIDSTPSLSADDRCRLNPAQGRRIAVTLIATSGLTGENSAATVRESWGTMTSASFSASTPLVAQGTINIVGTFTIVDAPNAGGYGIPASIWTPQNAGGNGSWQTCPMEDYQGNFTAAQLYTDPGCAATTPSTCHCNTELLSTGGNPDGIDILDKDGGGGNPDITFFPGSSDFTSQANRDATRMDYRLCTGAGAPYSTCTPAGVCRLARGIPRRGCGQPWD